MPSAQGPQCAICLGTPEELYRAKFGPLRAKVEMFCPGFVKHAMMRTDDLCRACAEDLGHAQFEQMKQCTAGIIAVKDTAAALIAVRHANNRKVH